MKLLVAFALILVMAFSTFGLLATLEPGDPGELLRWRALYGAVLVCCLVGLAGLLGAGGKKD